MKPLRRRYRQRVVRAAFRDRVSVTACMAQAGYRGLYYSIVLVFAGGRRLQ